MPHAMSKRSTTGSPLLSYGVSFSGFVWHHVLYYFCVVVSGFGPAPYYASGWYAEFYRWTLHKQIPASVFMDDWATVGTDQSEALANRRAIKDLFSPCGLLFSDAKDTDDQRLVYLGILFDTVAMTMSSEPEKAAALRTVLVAHHARISSGSNLPHAEIRSIAGKLGWYAQVLQSGRLHTRAWWLYVVFRAKLLAPTRARLLKDTLWWIAVLATWESSENEPQQFPLLSADSFHSDLSRASVVVSDASGPDGFGYYYAPLGSDSPQFGAFGTINIDSSIPTAASLQHSGISSNERPPRVVCFYGYPTTSRPFTASTRERAGRRKASLSSLSYLPAAMHSALYCLPSGFLMNLTVFLITSLISLFSLGRTSPVSSHRTPPTPWPPQPPVSWTTPSSRPSPTQPVSTPAVWNRLCRIQETHYLSALQRKPTTSSALTTAPANLSNENSLGRRRQAKLAQLRTGISNTMGQYQRLIDGNFSANHNKKCRWCGDLNETVTHVYNDCTDLQIQALRNDIYT